MTKKTNFTACLIAIMVMLFSLPANAQGTVGYAQWDKSSSTLTFYGGESVPVGAYALNTGDSSPMWNSVARGSCTKVVFDESFKDVRPTSCCRWFYWFSNLTTIVGIKYLNTEEVTDMSYMFNRCEGLTSLDLSSFNTANVTNMHGMFFECSGLKSLDVSSFNTANVTNMDGMFWLCAGLTSLDLSSFNTANVTDMNEMFYGCSGLTSLDLSSFNTANVTDMGGLFSFCSGLTSLDLSSFNTANVTDMNHMFWDCSGLTSLALSSFSTAKVKYMYSMFNGCLGLTSLDLSSFNTAKVMAMDWMFDGCSSLTTIYVSDYFTTGKVYHGKDMFANCYELKGAVAFDSNNTDHFMANYRTGYFKTYFKLGDSKVELCGVPLTAESLDLSGDYDFTPKHEFTAQSATYTRDLSSSKSTWFSLCLPFAYTPENFTAYQLQGATEDAVEIEQITGEIAAGTPVLFKFNDGDDKMISISATDAQIVKVPVDGTTASGTDGSSLQLCGTYQNKNFSLEDNNAFILMNDKLMNPAKMLENSNVTKVGVKPFRGYMTLTASAESPAQQARARAFSIGHGEEGGTTAIDLLNSVATDDAEYYDINGRRINAPAKGVNVVRRGNKTMKLIVK